MSLIDILMDSLHFREIWPLSSRHFHERPLGWAGLWRTSVPRGRDVQESAVLPEDR